MRKLVKYDWGDEIIYRKVGDNIVLRNECVYNFDDDGWRYAPDVYFEYVMDNGEADYIEEDEARFIVEKNGGKNFDSVEEVLEVTDKEGNLSGIYEAE